MVIVVELEVVLPAGGVVVQMMNGMQNHYCSCSYGFFYECFVPLPPIEWYFPGGFCCTLHGR